MENQIFNEFLHENTYFSNDGVCICELTPSDDFALRFGKTTLGFLTLFGSLLISSGITSIVLGFVNNSLARNMTFDEDISIDPDIPYEEKYQIPDDEECESDDDDNNPSEKDDFDTTNDEARDDSGDEERDVKQINENTFIFDLTPDGYVAMSYSNYHEGFSYWGPKNTKVKYLEACARKYALQTGNTQIYKKHNKFINFDEDSLCDSDSEDDRDIEETNEIVSQSEEEQSQNGDENEDDETEDDKEESVFANLKTRNKPTATKTVTTVNDFETNKFIWKGKFQDFKMTQDVSDIVHDEKKTLDFKSFKQMFWN